MRDRQHARRLCCRARVKGTASRRTSHFVLPQAPTRVKPPARAGSGLTRVVGLSVMGPYPRRSCRAPARNSRQLFLLLQPGVGHAAVGPTHVAAAVGLHVLQMRAGRLEDRQVPQQHVGQILVDQVQSLAVDDSCAWRYPESRGLHPRGRCIRGCPRRHVVVPLTFPEEPVKKAVRIRRVGEMTGADVEVLGPLLLAMRGAVHHLELQVDADLLELRPGPAWTGSG